MMGNIIEDAWRRYKEENDKAAKEVLFAKYIPLVKHIATKMALKLPKHIDLRDLISYGLVGLAEAMERFDPSKGYKFETYAVPRIKGAILQELRDLDWAPRSIRRKANKLEEAYACLEAELGRAASDEEMADYLGMSLQQFHRLLEEIGCTSILSLDMLWENGDGSSVCVLEQIADESTPDPLKAVEKEEMRQILAKAIEDLPEQERAVISLYYYESLTLREIGEILGVSESRVSQIHTKATLRLRSKLKRVERSMRK